MTQRLHDDEVPVGDALVRALLRSQRPEWAELPLARVGAGTDNTMYRLGMDKLVRLPRTPGTAGAVMKERTWLPRLAAHLPLEVPDPVHLGAPDPLFPLPWSVYRWIDGREVGPDSIADWATLGTDLARFVASLHSIDLMCASRDGDLGWYRGGSLRAIEGSIAARLEECHRLEALDLDVAALEGMWAEALELPDPSGAHVWLHADLRPSNLLARNGRLVAVIDFGGLCVGWPAAEHAPVWDLPPAARAAYRAALELDDQTWLRARAWAIAVAVSGVPYYWETYPTFVRECVARLRAVLNEDSDR